MNYNIKFICYKIINSLFLDFKYNVIINFNECIGDYNNLYQEEKLLIHNNASLTRKNAFASGRLGVKSALKLINIHKYPIKANRHGMPIFPKNIYCSISHTHNLCLVVLFKSYDKIVSIGVDIELKNRVKYIIWNKIFNKNEILWLINNFNVYDQKYWATILFSAKESFFKFYYSLTKQMIYLKDINICINENKQLFYVTIHKKYLHSKLIQSLIGYFALIWHDNNHYIVTTIYYSSN